MSDYFKQRDDKNLEKIDRLLAEMPEFVGQFIVGISSQTSVLTRLNYVTDIGIFFSYLIKYKYPGKRWRSFLLTISSALLRTI